ncbi:hypothetical protein AAX05_02430 [Moraxella bovoculi]|uniref:DUF697 domain-containing protein n=1 Tax=Moraxella bovoculi TaxID=386891 RepID=A0AAC8T8C7_9GAMM|nr:hypothetical protein [Moraxella bovoculi]AKG08227.1 hypothetical protein AAX06_08805 [Moraxella bovoculi]AKG09217.1 hypothetical protein AAX05_02430 [Moraxella bovoculi]AKG11051.1 hypothetical protein AAX07_02470 [Moraxella bovoculi]AKG13043.1 hypothetical protein AAX11_02185 [Moraxella bovoculi]
MSLTKPISQPTAKDFDPTINLEKVRAECQELAKSRAKISAGVAIIPLPFLDVAIDVGMLSKLLPEITKKFGLEEPTDPRSTASEAARRQTIQDRILAISGLVATRGVVNKTIQGFGGRIIGKQVAKYVPLGGQMVAATIGYMIFKKIAFDHIEQCYQVAKEAQLKGHQV